ncbi:TlpA disulfide reductase family protein [Pedobacter agri]|uniref:TlpA family protein disulfide reductase n=1 Tax=Pedobacter agri TaxID=454586 RepID=UPI0029311A66|nr:TlpA disulfide reductase family protein [Pedobacter agri]
MKKIIILFACLILGFVQTAKTQAKVKSSSPPFIKIKIHTEDGNPAASNRKLIFTVYKYFSNVHFLMNSSVLTINGNINGLDTTLALPSSVGYLRIDYLIDGKRGKNHETSFREYRVSTGEQLEINLYKDSLGFLGPDAVALNLQTELFAIGRPKDNKIAWSDSEYFKKQQEGFQQSYLKGLRFLEKNKTKITPDLYHYLSAQWLGYRNYRQVKFIVDSRQADTLLGRKAVAYYLKHKPDSARIAHAQPHEASFLTDYLFLKERLDFEIQKKERRGNYDKGAEIILERLKSKYSGELRDKVILTGIVGLSKIYQDADTYLSKNDKLIPKTSYYYELSQIIKNTFSENSSAFNFSLEDENGRMVSMKDLRGKAVILDFWFTGCHACIEVKKFMEPIHARFATNKNLAFVTISIDKDKAIWLQSIKTGIFTHPGSINLFAKGLYSPVIQHYNITSYPKIMLIDKNGKIISANLPVPSDKTGEKELLKILEKTVN